MVSEDRRGNPLGEESTVAESEWHALVLALREHRNCSLPYRHIGDEKAEQLAAFASAFGQVSLKPSVVMESGIRKASKARRSEAGHH
ncbi:hypothetical protein BGX38DRAFT_1270419 [Terfezia claveryi]|nr:hypothetical protein BGX38DRAFT_1270419 [Terfezia claveryi]